MMTLFPTPKFDFMRFRFVGYLISGIVLFSAIGALLWHRSRTGDALEYGIDFRGGTLMQVRFSSPPDLGRLRAALGEAGFGGAAIQTFGKPEENMILIRLAEDLEGNRDLVAKARGALRPGDELAREAQGFIDLNSVGEADLAALLEREITGTNEKSPEPLWNRVATAIVAARGAAPGGRLTSLDQLGSISDLTADMREALENRTYLGSISFLRTESVGPVVGKDLRSKALFAAVVANGLILVYLWFRFELRFGVAAVLCLTHDVLFVLGVFAITRKEFDLNVLAAILTVIGYSVNDTIVIFDRVRHNLKLMRREPLPAILNLSINQTLSRTVITSGFTLLAVLGLWLYGGPVLNGFAFALLIGLVEGSYSTIFVASPLLLVWERWFPAEKTA